jgi:hypothetical protein
MIHPLHVGLMRRQIRPWGGRLRRENGTDALIGPYPGRAGSTQPTHFIPRSGTGKR